MRKIIQHINNLLMNITLKRIMRSFKLKGEIKVITKEDIFRELRKNKTPEIKGITIISNETLTKEIRKELEKDNSIL